MTRQRRGERARAAGLAADLLERLAQLGRVVLAVEAELGPDHRERGGGEHVAFVAALAGFACDRIVPGLRAFFGAEDQHGDQSTDAYNFFNLFNQVVGSHGPALERSASSASCCTGAAAVPDPRGVRARPADRPGVSLE